MTRPGRREFAQPVQGERWPGAITQQPLAPGTVGSLDAHRAIDGKPAAVIPLRHRACVVARQQAAAREQAQQPPTHACLHVGDGVGLEPDGGMEDDPARGSGVEHAVDDHAMEVEVGIEKNWHCFVNSTYDKVTQKWTCFKRKHVDLVDKSKLFKAPAQAPAPKPATAAAD